MYHTCNNSTHVFRFSYNSFCKCLIFFQLPAQLSYCRFLNAHPGKYVVLQRQIIIKGIDSPIFSLFFSCPSYVPPGPCPSCTPPGSWWPQAWPWGPQSCRGEGRGQGGQVGWRVGGRGHKAARILHSPGFPEKHPETINQNMYSKNITISLILMCIYLELS